MTDLQREILKLGREGLCATAIAARLGCRQEWVGKTVRRYGVVLTRSPHDQTLNQWPEDRIDRLREMYGKMPVREIAAELGVSRSTIIGKAWRLGLSAPRKRPPKLAPPPPIEPTIDLSGLVTLGDLRPRDCRWVVGQPNGLATAFCGKRKTDESSYCAEHKAMSVRETYNRNTYRELTVQFKRDARRKAMEGGNHV